MTPEEALDLAKTVHSIYATATVRLLEAIGRATARGLQRPTWATTALLEVTRLRTEALRILGQADTAAARELLAQVEAAYTGGHMFAVGAGGVTRVDQRAVHALAADTIGLFRGTTPRMLRWTEDIYRQVVADTVAGAVTGAVSQRDVAAAALDRLTSAGAGPLVDTGGRRWQLDTYTDMATRTAIGRAHLAGTVDQYRADGRLWVIVSDSPEECPLCRPFEGTVLALDNDIAPPAVPGIRYAGTLTAAIARGLHHPNCTHRIHAYIPGLTRAIEWDRPDRRTQNPQGYEDRQRQRALERRVRDSKRRVAALRPLGNTPALRTQEALLRRRQATLSGFIKDAGRKAWVSAQRTQIPGGLPPKPRS